jgi:hypothetical protein
MAIRNAGTGEMDNFLTLGYDWGKGEKTMTKTNHTDHKPFQWLRWIARIWGTLVLIIALFVFIGYASDVLTNGESDPYATEDYPPIENLPPLFIFLSALGLGLAWRWEGWGGAIAIFFQLASLPVLLIHWPIAEDFSRYLIAPYGISLMVTIPGILFLIYWSQTRKHAEPTKTDSPN